MRETDIPQDVQVARSSRKLANDGAHIAASYTVTTILTVLIPRYSRGRPFVEISDMIGWMASDGPGERLQVRLQTQSVTQEAGKNCYEKPDQLIHDPLLSIILPLIHFFSVSPASPEELEVALRGRYYVFTRQ